MDWKRLLALVAMGVAAWLGWRFFGPAPPPRPEPAPPPGNTGEAEAGEEGRPAPAAPAAKAGWTDHLEVGHEGTLGELLDWLEGEVAFVVVLDRADPLVADRLGKDFSLAGVMTPGNILSGIAEMARFDLVVVHDGAGEVSEVRMEPGAGRIEVQTP